MARTRIRWQNVGRVAGGIAVGAVALFAAADLLEPPPPEPLPADVGLATGATGAVGYEPGPAAPEPRDDDRTPRPTRPAETAADAGRRTEREGPRAEREGPRDPEHAPSGLREDSRPGKPARQEPPPDATTPASSPANPPPSPPAPVTPAPAAPTPPVPAPDVEAEEPVPGDVKAEFGFEPN